MNQAILQGLSFDCAYDGTTTTIVIDSRRGPLNYAPKLFNPMFWYVVASGISNVVLDSTPATATINNAGFITITVPSGLSAGILNISLDLLY